MAGIIKVNQYQDFNGNTILTSDGSGNLTTQKIMYPAFRAYRSSSQSITDNADTKVQMDAIDFDTNSYYDNTTNYRYTPLVAGKYFVSTQVTCGSSSSEDIHFALVYIYKNGSVNSKNIVDPHNGSKANQSSNYFSNIITMNGTTDYLEIYAKIDTSSGTPSIGGESDSTRTYFSAYRIGS